MTFSDNGAAFDPVNTVREDREFEDLEFGGMGIDIARGYSKEMIYDRINGRNVLTLRFECDDR